MSHPILSQGKIFRLYAIVWILIAVLHMSIDWLIYQVNVPVFVADSLIFNGLMFFIGLSIWYPVFYIDTSKGKWSAIMQYTITGVVVILVWLFLGKAIIKIVMGDEALEMLFDDRSYAIRAIVGVFQFILFVMIYYMFIFFNELEEQNQKKEKLNRLLRESELKALKSQLNPHFLFNSLNSISALTITDADDAREMINKLSEFMRYSLRKNENTLLPLRDELKNVARYMAIEKVRFGDRLNCETDIPAQCKDLLVPVMILQPLFENAVKYGVYESIEPVNVRTFCRYLNGDLEISVVNNYDEEALRTKKGVGVGLDNVRDRLQLHYGRTDLLTVTKENGYFEVALLVPQATAAIKN